MPREWWFRVSIYALMFLVSVYLLLPTILQIPEDQLTDEARKTGPWYLSWMPTTRLNLGLDLRGGVHIVLGIETSKAVEAEAEKTAQDIEEYAKQEKIALKSVRRPPGGKDILITPADAKAETEIRKALKDQFYSTIDLAGTSEGALRYVIRPDRESEIKSSSVDQALRTIRNRVDMFGVSEPVIQKQSSNQILVQLPGFTDPDRAMELIGRTAVLEFKIVDDSKSEAELMALVAEVRDKVGFRDNFTAKMVTDLNAALKEKLPKETEILFEKETDETSGAVRLRPYLLNSRTVLTGDSLDDARVSTSGDRLNMPVVRMDFNARGGRIFEKITGENVGKRLAIVLDDVVVSAPVIQGKIPATVGAQITLGRGSRGKLYREAQDISLVLRAGALPAPVQVQENRTVGATLGADSIEKGTRSIIIGAIFVIIFMVLYYRLSGVLADVALVLNVFFILGSLALFQAALTLPGIAGIVLTIGMAVDANVIINERIREETKLGKNLRAAVEAGYSNARLTIIDANLTTAIAAFALYYFGTGPIRGFAVTLLIGLISSYITALLVTKAMFQLLMNRFGLERLYVHRSNA